jgi:hypothetical protein
VIDTVRATETVEVRRLDDLFDDLVDGLVPGRPNVFLKIDTQGWDLEVLRGAASTLPRIAALQTEVSVQQIYEAMPTVQDALEYLDQLGFAVSGLFPVTLDQQLRVVEFDCIAVRAQGRPRPGHPLGAPCFRQDPKATNRDGAAGSRGGAPSPPSSNSVRPGVTDRHQSVPENRREPIS